MKVPAVEAREILDRAQNLVTTGCSDILALLRLCGNANVPINIPVVARKRSECARGEHSGAGIFFSGCILLPGVHQQTGAFQVQKASKIYYGRDERIFLGAEQTPTRRLLIFKYWDRQEQPITIVLHCDTSQTS